MRAMDWIAKRTMVSNPCLFYAPANSLTAFERQQPSSASGGMKALSLTGSGAVRYQPASGAGWNYTPNSRFANDTTAWSTQAGATITRVVDGSFSGGTAAEIIYSGAGSGAALTTAANAPNVAVPGQQYAISADIQKISGALTSVVFGVQWYTAGGSFISLTNATPSITGSVVRYSTVVTAPASAHRVGIIVLSSTDGTIRVSNLKVEFGSTATPYFDGSTSPVSAWLDPITGYLGTAHASPSVSQAAFWPWEGTTNAIADPSFEAASITTNWQALASATISKVTTHACVGSNGGKVSCTASASDGMQQGVGNAPAALTGQTWTLSGRIRAFASGDVGKTVKPYLVERDGADAQVLVNTGGTITLTDAWQLFTYTVTLSGGGTVAKVSARFLNGAAVAVDFVLDAVQLEQKAYATAYCDGSLGTGHAWTGTANASSSTRTETTVRCAHTNRAKSPYGSLFILVNKDRGNPANSGRFVEIGQYGTTAGDVIAPYCSSETLWKMDDYSYSGGGLSSADVTVVTSATLGLWYSMYFFWSKSMIGGSANGAGVSSGARGFTPVNFFDSVNTSMGIGCRPTATGSQFNGIIGPLIIYDSPLTAAELAKLVALGPAANFTSILRVS